MQSLVALLDSSHVGPVNIEIPDEFTVLELAHAALDVTGSRSDIVFQPLPTDDTTQRRPDISLAGEVLGWHAEVALREGLERTAAWFAGTGERPPVAATTVRA